MLEYVGQTPLTIAAGEGLARVGELLPAWKATSPDPGWHRSRAPLLLAAKKDMRMWCGCFGRGRCHPNTQDVRGETLIPCALGSEHEGIVTLLWL